jgi:hypothetical protein
MKWRTRSHSAVGGVGARHLSVLLGTQPSLRREPQPSVLLGLQPPELLEPHPSVLSTPTTVRARRMLRSVSDECKGQSLRPTHFWGWRLPFVLSKSCTAYKTIKSSRIRSFGHPKRFVGSFTINTIRNNQSACSLHEGFAIYVRTCISTQHAQLVQNSQHNRLAGLHRKFDPMD